MRGWVLCFILAPSMAGCFGPKADIVLDAHDARVLAPYGADYEGKSLRKATGTLHVELDSARNTARVQADADDGSHRYGIVWTEVRGAAPYQSGGVAKAIRLHGETGNGTPEWPAFNAYAAAWGKARLTIDGRAEADPTDRSETFDASLYVVRGRVRDPATGMVVDASKRAAYNPSKPANAFVDPEGAQAMLLLRLADGTPWRGLEYESLAFAKY